MKDSQRHHELETIRQAAKNLGYRAIVALPDADLEKLVLQIAEMIASSGLSADQIVDAVRNLVQQRSAEQSDRLTETIQAMRDYIDTRKMKVIKSRLSRSDPANGADEG